METMKFFFFLLGSYTFVVNSTNVASTTALKLVNFNTTTPEGPNLPKNVSAMMTPVELEIAHRLASESVQAASAQYKEGRKKAADKYRKKIDVALASYNENFATAWSKMNAILNPSQEAQAALSSAKKLMTFAGQARSAQDAKDSQLGQDVQEEIQNNIMATNIDMVKESQSHEEEVAQIQADIMDTKKAALDKQAKGEQQGRVAATNSMIELQNEYKKKMAKVMMLKKQHDVDIHGALASLKEAKEAGQKAHDEWDKPRAKALETMVKAQTQIQIKEDQLAVVKQDLAEVQDQISNRTDALKELKDQVSNTSEALSVTKLAIIEGLKTKSQLNKAMEENSISADTHRATLEAEINTEVKTQQRIVDQTKAVLHEIGELEKERQAQMSRKVSLKTSKDTQLNEVEVSNAKLNNELQRASSSLALVDKHATHHMSSSSSALLGTLATPNVGLNPNQKK